MAPIPLHDLATAAGCPAAVEIYRLDCLVRDLMAAVGRSAHAAARADLPAEAGAGGSAVPRGQADQPARDPADAPAVAGAWSRALALGLDPTAEQLVIQAGIGWLRITPAEVDWRPVQPRSGVSPSPTPQPAPEALRIARLAACQACARFEGGRCSVAGCGCAGQGTPGAFFSRCPLDRWGHQPATPNAS